LNPGKIQNQAEFQSAPCKSRLTRRQLRLTLESPTCLSSTITKQVVFATQTQTDAPKKINKVVVLYPDFSTSLILSENCQFKGWLQDEHNSFQMATNCQFNFSAATEKGAWTAWNGLSPQSKKLALDPNAGGNSVWSEVYSFELLKRAFGAELVKTEMEIEYYPEGSKKTDYICKIHDQLVGVSVTRAMKFKGEFTREDAAALLNKKLFGVLQSTQNVSGDYNWKKQILHVWAENSTTAQHIRDEFESTHPALRSNTIVIVTETQANGKWIFSAYFPDFLKTGS